jgi:hypothetical protein
MNKDEILNMPAGDKIDALVRSYMGVQKLPLIWKPSQDIRDAWEVVEKLSGKSAFVEVTLYDCGHVSCKLHPFKYIYVEADTAPLAICRAALLTTLEPS